MVNSAENTKFRDFFRDHGIAEFWRAWFMLYLTPRNNFLLMNVFNKILFFHKPLFVIQVFFAFYKLKIVINAYQINDDSV